jgi:hypothetical protein
LWKVTDNSLGIDETEQAFDFSVYPNPADDVLSIWLNQPADKNELQVVLFNCTGSKVNGLNFNTTQGNVISFNTAMFEKGVYFLTVGNNHSFTTRRVVIY